MSSPSVPDSVIYATPKGKSLTEQRSITGDKSASDLNPSHQVGGSGKQKKRKRKNGHQVGGSAKQKTGKRKNDHHVGGSGKQKTGKRKNDNRRERAKRHKAMQQLLSSIKGEEEKENGEIVHPSTMPSRLQDKGLQSRFPIHDDHHVRHTDQTRPSEYEGRVHGDGHIPSSAPVISNAPSPPDTSKATSVVQPSSSFSEKTPLPKPALVSPAPLQPPDKVQKSGKNRCSTQDIASGFMHDNNTRNIQLHSNVENISEVPAEAPEEKSMEKGGKYMGTNDGSKQPANSVSVRNDLCDVKSKSQFVHKSHVAGRNHLSTPRHTRDDHILHREDKHISPSKDKHILRREDKRAVSGKGLRPQRGLNRPDINARLNAKRVKLAGPGHNNGRRVSNLKKKNYHSHINGSVHLRKKKYSSKRAANLKQAVSDAIKDQVQRGDGNSALFAELLTTVLSKQFAATESEHIKACAKIPAPTTMAGPSSEPQLLQTQASEIQAHVEIKDSSGKTKTELAVDAEILAAPTSMAGPSYEAQLLQSQVSEIKARVDMENPSRETRPGLEAAAAEILAPIFITGPSCEPQLLQTQGSEIKTHVEMENASGETKAELAMAAEIPSPASMSGPSYEPRLLQTQVSDTKAHVGMENPSGEIETEHAVTAEVPVPTSVTGLSHEPLLLKAQVSESKKHVEIENLSDETKTVTCPSEVKI